MCNELVSIYITTYNRSGLLVNAINSVLNQTYRNIEIIVSDDGSVDNTPELMEQICHSNLNVKYIRSNESNGACIARNKAIKMAKGKYITGLDDDDEFLPDRIEKFVDNWDPKYSFICDDFYDVSNGFKKRHYGNKKPLVISFDELLTGNLASNQIFTLTERFRAISGFRENLKKFQDWECWIRLSYTYGDFLRLSHTSYLMHHNSNISRVSNSQKYNDAFINIMQIHSDKYRETHVNFINRYVLNNEEIQFIDLLKYKYLSQKKIIFIKLIKNFRMLVNEK